MKTFTFQTADDGTLKAYHTPTADAALVTIEPGTPLANWIEPGQYLRVIDHLHTKQRTLYFPLTEVRETIENKPTKQNDEAATTGS